MHADIKNRRLRERIAQRTAGLRVNREHPLPESDNRPRLAAIHREHVSTYRYHLVQSGAENECNTAGIRIAATQLSRSTGKFNAQSIRRQRLCRD